MLKRRTGAENGRPSLPPARIVRERLQLSQGTALVTGGAGFIASHVADALIREGFRVGVVDSMVTGRMENLNAEASFHRVDIRSPQLENVFRELKPRTVFHLAAQSSVTRSLRDPQEDAATNVMGSVSLLEQCRRFGVERFVYTSTGGPLYGEPIYRPCPETHPVRALSPYAASKYAVEAYVYCFSELVPFRYTILRYANVYGPRQDPEGEAGVVGIFARRMLTGDPVVIYGDGQQERDFVYVGDVVDANILALEQEVNDVYNIGTGVATSVNQVFDGLKGLTGYSDDPRHEPARQGEVYKIHLDIRKAARQLGWAPKTDLESGLTRTVEHHRAQLAHQRA